MRKNLTTAPFIAVSLLLVILLPLHVSANGPTPAWRIDCQVQNAPEGAQFTDLLIEIDPDDAAYTPYNAAEGELFRLGEDSGIVQYAQDGFRSYTFHYREAQSSLLPDKNGHHYYAEDQLNTLLKRHSIVKLAVLDANGDILCVSPPMELAPGGPRFFTGHITYDAAAGTVDYSIYYSSMSLVFLVVLVIFRMLLSITVETLLAIPFRFGAKYKIMLLNLATQVGLLIFQANSPLAYLPSLVIGEVCVLLLEFFALRLLYRDMPLRRVAVYSVVANAASLAIGLWVNV